MLALLVALLMAFSANVEGAANRSGGVSLYFVSGSGRTLFPVVRAIASPTPRKVVAAVVAGPNRAERAKGAAAVVPPQVQVLRAPVIGSGATVALRSPTLIQLATIPRLRMIAALTYTLTGLPGIRSVRFSVNGRPWGVYDLHGKTIRDYSRATLRPGTNACAPTYGCFSP
jgi:spore germination protein GerM